MSAQKSIAGESPMQLKKVLSVLGMAVLIFAAKLNAADQKTFATPTEAVKALVKAAADSNQEEMLAIFGDEGKALVYSGDAVQDQKSLADFVKAYKAKHAIVKQDESTQILQVGVHDWEMPIPIVKTDGKWRFDTAAGKQELVYERIGGNELGAIGVCRGFISAQKDYSAVGHDGLPAGIYAQKLASDPGKQNGLYWEAKEGEEPSPSGPFLAKAGGEGYDLSGGIHDPYHGFYYRILMAQGAAAKGGAKSYVVDGQLKTGVALLAFPAEYKVSGVMSFIINQNGIVYQKDLGEKTAELADAMKEYNPDSTWKRVTD
jgi:hypothetical protein